MRVAVRRASARALAFFWADQQGAAMVEYGLLVTLIGLVVALSALLLSHQISTMFSEIGSYVATYPQI